MRNRMMVMLALIACLASLLLAACGKSEPPLDLDLMDPCMNIGSDADEASLKDPHSKYWQAWRKQCDELRRQAAPKAKAKIGDEELCWDPKNDLLGDPSDDELKRSAAKYQECMERHPDQRPTKEACWDPHQVLDIATTEQRQQLLAHYQECLKRHPEERPPEHPDQHP